MATRLLLTFLALLASLAAQLTPAQARVRAGGESEIGQSLGVIEGERIAVSPASFAASASHWHAHSHRAVTVPDAPRVFTPTVRLRIDRARE